MAHPVVLCGRPHLTKDGWDSLSHHTCSSAVWPCPQLPRQKAASSCSFESESCLCFETASVNAKVLLCHFWAQPWIDLEAFTLLLLEAKHHRRRATTLRPPSHVEGPWKMGCYEERDGWAEAPDMWVRKPSWAWVLQPHPPQRCTTEMNCPAEWALASSLTHKVESKMK